MSPLKDSFVIHIKEHKSVLQQPACTLLESIEKHDIEVHYACREGFCGSCRTKLISGQVKYTIDPLAYMDDDEILPCCCVPLSDIEIELS
ncbi:MAG: ferredoxin [Paraglaciecola sp.]|jgi:ferredoxin